jgi:hypothetical protein
MVTGTVFWNHFILIKMANPVLLFIMSVHLLEECIKEGESDQLPTSYSITCVNGVGEMSVIHD